MLSNFKEAIRKVDIIVPLYVFKGAEYNDFCKIENRLSNDHDILKLLIFAGAFLSHLNHYFIFLAFTNKLSQKQTTEIFGGTKNNLDLLYM